MIWNTMKLEKEQPNKYKGSGRKEIKTKAEID